MPTIATLLLGTLTRIAVSVTNKDGMGIHRGFDENLQQAIDRLAPVRVAAMIELVSLQLAATAFVNSVIPTAVSMHVGTQDEESDDEEPENLYAASCEEDLDHLSNDELQFLVHSLSGQLKKSGKPAACGAHAAPPKSHCRRLQRQYPHPQHLHL